MDFSSFLAFPLEQLPYVFIALVLAFTLHEFAHAYVAYRFGDPTAKNQGRLTLNPLVHLDPIGTILILVAGFGWARPVPVNRFHFKNPRLAGVLVSVAGPLSNLLLAFIFLFVWFLLNGSGWINGVGDGTYDQIYSLFNTIIYLNVVLFLFNLFPLPPLDGYRIIEDLVPNRVRVTMTQYENYGAIIFIILFITPLGDYVFRPLFDVGVPAVFDLLEAILSPIWRG